MAALQLPSIALKQLAEAAREAANSQGYDELYEDPRDLGVEEALDVSKQEQIVNLVSASNGAARVRYLFVCVWNAWARLALVTAARRDAAIEVRFYVNYFADMWLTKEEPKALRAFLQNAFKAWFGAHQWAVQLRTLSFTAERLLERCQIHESATIKQFTFALWQSRLVEKQTTDVPMFGGRSAGQVLHKAALQASGNVTDVGATQLWEINSSRIDFTRFSGIFESLVSVRSRSWRLVCDIKSMAEGSLLRAKGLHEAVQALLKQVAIMKPHLPRFVGDANDFLDPMAEVIRLSSDAENHDELLQTRRYEHQPAIDALVKYTSNISDMLVKLQIGDSDVRYLTSEEQTQAMNLCSCELSGIRSDQQKAIRACAPLLSRIEDSGLEMKTFAAVRQELFGIAALYGMPSDLSRADTTSQERAFDDAGQTIRRLIQGALMGVTMVLKGARNLLQYLDASAWREDASVGGGETAYTNRGTHAQSNGTRWGAPEMPALAPHASLEDWRTMVGDMFSSVSEMQSSENMPHRLAVSWLEDEILVAAAPPVPSRKRGPDRRMLGEFHAKWKYSRMQWVWRAWTRSIQLIHRLHGESLGVSGFHPSRRVATKASRDSRVFDGIFGGPTGPATRDTVGSVQKLLLG